MLHSNVHDIFQTTVKTIMILIYYNICSSIIYKQVAMTVSERGNHLNNEQFCCKGFVKKIGIN